MSLAAPIALLAADVRESLEGFPHELHLEEVGLGCEDCHARAPRSVRADDNLRPLAEACLDCHEAETVPPAWGNPGREYSFSHQHHVADLSLACAHCHAGIESPDRTVLPVMPSMATCMTCHNGTGAARDCEGCHTLGRLALVPDAHHPGWSQEHGLAARITDDTCVPCHAISECQECHQGGMLVELAGSRGVRQSPFAPELEGSHGTTMQRVHGMNYRFLHAAEARGKSSDCFACHDLDAGYFCAECHNPKVNPDIRPIWHGGADWGMLAMASGGGRHAELARRDLENCMVCRDTPGDDPSCLLCHVDRLPGRGNDPSPHSRSFPADIGHGDFHDDAGAICFNCHVSDQPVGADGFCEYCHGSR